MYNKPYPPYEVKRITNLRQLIDFRASASPSDVAFMFERDRENTERITFSELKKQTEALGTAYYSLGMNKRHIAILGENSYNWLLHFFALTGGNIIVVPLDKELSADILSKTISDSDCTALVFSDTYSDIAEQIKNQTGIECINMTSTDALIQNGNELIEKGNREYLDHKVDEDSYTVIVYTSGTTGISKGVMLSHKNLAMDTYLSCCHCNISGNVVLFLPLHHTFGMVAGVFMVMLYGYSIYINSSLRYLMSDLNKVKPRILFLVPLLVETIYKNILNTAEQQGIKDKNQLINYVSTMLGGNLNTIVSGGAPLNPKFIQGFRDLGITLLNGYGITECSPVISVNRNEYYKDGSVGQILNECEVFIENPNANGIGEICFKGTNVMLGYYKMESETEKVIKNGWFHTGDLGYLDSENFLFITGRKKNTIILNNGENVAPEELEIILQNIPLISEVIVFDDNGKIGTEIYPNLPYAEKQGITDILAEIKKCINKINADLPRYKQINSVYLRDTEFEKTTTKKIKRVK